MYRNRLHPIGHHRWYRQKNTETDRHLTRIPTTTAAVSACPAIVEVGIANRPPSKKMTATAPVAAAVQPTTNVLGLGAMKLKALIANSVAKG